MRQLCLSALLALLTACPRHDSSQPETPPDPGPTLPALRPGAVVLMSESSSQLPYVFDAAVVGTRLVALVRVALATSPPYGERSSEDYLFTSDDDGRSWTSHLLEPKLYPVGLLPAGADLYLVGSSSADYPIYRLDPQTFQASFIARLPSWPSFLGGGIAAGTSPASYTVEVSRFDPATKEVSETVVTLPGKCQLALASADGETFEGVCYLIDRRCWVTVRAGETTAQSSCLGYREWPLPARATQAPIAIDGRVWLAWGEGGHVLARRMENGAFGTTLDLGPGGLEQNTLQRYFRFRPSYGPLLPLRDAGNFTRLRLLELGSGSTPREVVVAASPCLDDDACPSVLTELSGPDTRLQRLLPLGDDRYLALYLLVKPPADPMYPLAREWHLIARVATNGEVAAPPFVTAGLSSGQTNVLEYVPAATPLEQTCARAIACFPGILQMKDCLLRFSRVEGADPEADMTLARFLATPAGDCSAFRATYPQLALAREGQTACVGPWAVNLDGTYFDCEAAGLPCTVADGRASCGSRVGSACGCDAQGRAVLCNSSGVVSLQDCAARGQQCAMALAGATCTTGQCAGDYTGWCMPADMTVQCEYGVPVSWTDCSRLALPCGQSFKPDPGGTSGRQEAECVADYGDRTCQPDDSDSCSGPYAVYCIGRERRFIDCPALGFSGCTQTTHDLRFHASCSP